jgi:hypothetical protein
VVRSLGWEVAFKPLPYQEGLLDGLTCRRKLVNVGANELLHLSFHAQEKLTADPTESIGAMSLSDSQSELFYLPAIDELGCAHAARSLGSGLNLT